MNSNSPNSRRSLWTLLAVAAVALIGYLSTGEISTETIGALLGEDATSAQQAPVAQPQAEAPPNTASGNLAYRPVSGLPLIPGGALPPEAHETMSLIARNGPFPYSQDGALFQNRERLLPLADVGYYREYTVETPGSPDRGARRIVGGADGELYYTDDHYDSFREIVPEGMEAGMEP